MPKIDIEFLKDYNLMVNDLSCKANKIINNKDNQKTKKTLLMLTAMFKTAAKLANDCNISKDVFVKTAENNFELEFENDCKVYNNLRSEKLNIN